MGNNGLKGGEDFYNEIEETAKKESEELNLPDFANMPAGVQKLELSLDPTTMTREQLIARNNETSSRIQKQAISKNVIPMPSADEINKMYEDELQNSEALYVSPSYWSLLIGKLTNTNSEKPSLMKYILYKFFKLTGIYYLIMNLPYKKKN